MGRIHSIMKIAFCALMLATFCWAGITGSISGVMTDPGSTVISGAIGKLARSSFSDQVSRD